MCVWLCMADPVSAPVAEVVYVYGCVWLTLSRHRSLRWYMCMAEAVSVPVAEVVYVYG